MWFYELLYGSNAVSSNKTGMRIKLNIPENDVDNTPYLEHSAEFCMIILLENIF